MNTNSVVRSVENRLKLINYLLTIHQGFMTPSRQFPVTSAFESCTIRAYKAKKINPESTVKILLGVNEKSEVDYCWFEVDGKEHLKITEDYTKVVKISLLNDNKRGLIKGEADKMGKAVDLINLMNFDEAKR